MNKRIIRMHQRHLYQQQIWLKEQDILAKNGENERKRQQLSDLKNQYQVKQSEIDRQYNIITDLKDKIHAANNILNELIDKRLRYQQILM